MMHCLTMIKNVIKDGKTISVWDGECWQIKRSKTLKEIIKAVDAVDVAEIRIRDSSGLILGWAMVSTANDLEDDETIIDHTENEYMNKVIPD